MRQKDRDSGPSVTAPRKSGITAVSAAKKYGDEGDKFKLMNITGGALKGRRLAVPMTKEVRPTQAKVRQAMFDSLQSKLCLEEARVLDLCCGSGAFGLEAYSRGAKHVVCVDKQVRYVTLNCKKCKIPDNKGIQIKRADAVTYLKKETSVFDLIFFDPPWDDKPLYQKVLDQIEMTSVLDKEGILLCEMRKRNKEPDFPDRFRIKWYNYGNTKVALLTHDNP